jgi:hypothetical protein
MTSSPEFSPDEQPLFEVGSDSVEEATVVPASPPIPSSISRPSAPERVSEAWYDLGGNPLPEVAPPPVRSTAKRRRAGRAALGNDGISGRDMSRMIANQQPPVPDEARRESMSGPGFLAYKKAREDLELEEIANLAKIDRTAAELRLRRYIDGADK